MAHSTPQPAANTRRDLAVRPAGYGVKATPSLPHSKERHPMAGRVIPLATSEQTLAAAAAAFLAQPSLAWS
jgi:hypothetical protein